MKDTLDVMRVRTGCVHYCNPDNRKGFLDELSYRVSLPGGKNKIIGCRLLKHAPHALDVVLGYEKHDSLEAMKLDR